MALPELPLRDDMKPGYLTIGRYVHLGRTDKRVRSNAIKAGLVPIDAKAMRKLVYSMMTSQRMAREGVWHDTVKYIP